MGSTIDCHFANDNDIYRYTYIRDAVVYSLQGTIPNQPADSASIANLVSAATSTVGSRLGQEINLLSKSVSVGISLLNGTTLNFGVSISKDPSDPEKAILQSSTGAVVTVLTTEILTVVATMAGAAIATSGIAATAITIGAGVGIAATAYFAGEFASNMAGHLYSNEYYPETIIRQDNGQDTVTTALSANDLCTTIWRNVIIPHND